jgi:hypothetical protein
MVAAMVAFAATPVGATAKMIHHEHHNERFMVDNTICGDIEAHSVWWLVENTALRLSPSGFPMFSGREHGTVTFTDTATGKSVSFKFTDGFREFAATDNGDGTFTRYAHVSGTESMIIAGQIVDRWSGHIVYRGVVDYNGTPADPDDDTFLSVTIVRSTGGPNSEPLNGCAILTQ